jgi:hypothetical protein
MVRHLIDHRRRSYRGAGMTTEGVRVSPGWLALREPADAAARARELVDELLVHLPASGLRVIHDLGCGTGAMGRWLAPLLPGRQHWVLHDRDPDLLKTATVDLPGPAADGAAVTVDTKQSDVSRLRSADLAGATLITASALLDLLTADELARLAGACVATGCPALLTLSVAGHVELTPGDGLDRSVAAAFDAHQRRTTERGSLLGPDAPAVAVNEFCRHGAEIAVRPSPWRLDASHASLATAWVAGWIDAACQQEPVLAARANGYKRRRLAEAGAGRLAVTVGHTDLLVLPRRPSTAPSSPH